MISVSRTAAQSMMTNVVLAYRRILPPSLSRARLCFSCSAALRPGGVTPIQISPLTYNDTVFWHQQVQPDIRKLPGRLDEHWHWPSLLLGLSAIELLRRRELIGYAALVQNRVGLAVPAGLVLLSIGFPALDEPIEDAVFLWYLTAAPTSTLTRLGVAAKPSLLEVLVDIGIVESDARGYQGRLGLHAANRGSSPASIALYNAYHQRCGLQPVPSTIKLPGVRRNDGRYFVATPGIASARMQALDYLR